MHRRGPDPSRQSSRESHSKEARKALPSRQSVGDESDLTLQIRPMNLASRFRFRLPKPIFLRLLWRTTAQHEPCATTNGEDNG